MYLFSFCCSFLWTYLSATTEAPSQHCDRIFLRQTPQILMQTNITNEMISVSKLYKDGNPINDSRTLPCLTNLMATETFFPLLMTFEVSPFPSDELISNVSFSNTVSLRILTVSSCVIANV